MNPVCIASLIVGVAGVFGAVFCLILGMPFGIAAVVTGIVGLTQVGGGSALGKAMAIAGICCGFVAFFLPVALLIGFGMSGG